MRRRVEWKARAEAESRRRACASPLISAIVSRHSAIMSTAAGRARKNMTPVLNHADQVEPDWWPQLRTLLLRGERSASYGTLRQSVPMRQWKCQSC